MSQSPQPVPTITAVPASATLQVGQSLEVVLEANATTGYEWTTQVMAGQESVNVGQTGYQPGPTKRPGAGGTSTTTITALAPGDAVVRFTYARPWDPEDNPTAADLRVTIEAGADGP